MEQIRFCQGISLFLLNTIIYVKAFDVCNNNAMVNLHCNTDYDEETEIFCHFNLTHDQTNCSEYELGLHLQYPDSEKICRVKHDKSLTGTCSCAFHMPQLYLTSFTTKLFKSGTCVQSNIFNVRSCIIPKVPTITSVKKTESGNFLVMWNNNYKKQTFVDSLRFFVTHGKRGEQGKVSHSISSTSYEIMGTKLQPSTEYVVSVKSYTEYSKLYSENSEDWTFKTPPSSLTTLVVIVAALCVVAIFIASSLFLCYTRFKEKWWDIVGKYKSSTFLCIVPGEHKVLQPQKTTLSSIYIGFFEEAKSDEKTRLSSSANGSCEGLHIAGGMDSGSSSLVYSSRISADTISNVQAALFIAPQIPLLSSVTSSFTTLKTNTHSKPCRWGSADFGVLPTTCMYDNKTYSLVVPQCDILAMSDNPRLFANFHCHPSKLGAFHDLSEGSQVPIFQVENEPSSDMQTDFSYQLWNADSGKLSLTNDIKTDLSYQLWNGVSGKLLPPSASLCVYETTELKSENFDVSPSDPADAASETTHVYGKEKLICDATLCAETLPAHACSLLQSDDDYQSIQNVVKQPVVLLIKESSDGQNDQPDKYPEEYLSQTHPSALNPGRPSAFEPESNNLFVLLTDQPEVITVDDYLGV